MAFSRAGLWCLAEVTAFLAGLAAGCQDDAFGLPGTSFGLNKADAAKAAAAEPCADVPGREAVVAEMLAAINAERDRRQLPPLRLDPTLAKLADFYACRLVEDGFFSHEDPFDGSTVDARASNFGYAFLKIGENLAAGQGTVEAAMRDLMTSPQHRANILDPAYTDVGLAVKLGGECGVYWVQEFGRPFLANVEPATTAATRNADEEAAADEAIPTTSQSAAKTVVTP